MAGSGSRSFRAAPLCRSQVERPRLRPAVGRRRSARRARPPTLCLGGETASPAARECKVGRSASGSYWRRSAHRDVSQANDACYYWTLLMLLGDVAFRYSISLAYLSQFLAAGRAEAIALVMHKIGRHLPPFRPRIRPRCRSKVGSAPGSSCRDRCTRFSGGCSRVVSRSVRTSTFPSGMLCYPSLIPYRTQAARLDADVPVLRADPVPLSHERFGSLSLSSIVLSILRSCCAEFAARWIAWTGLDSNGANRLG